MFSRRPTQPKRVSGLGLGAVTITILVLGFLVLVPGCTSERSSPTSPTSVAVERSADFAVASSSQAAESDAGAPSETSSSGSASEEFNCTHLQERFVRFSDPGYQKDNAVGLFYNFVGVPAGRAYLELFWDEESQPAVSQLIDLGEGEIQRNDDTRTDYRGVVEHAYPGISAPTEFAVRANLISKGRTGNCATVRRVTVTPGSAAPSAQSCPAVYGGNFAGGSTQLGRIFRDAIKSTCSGKAYPGIFNAGTTFNYETYNFKALGAGQVCVRVNFDPNTALSGTPCGTNAHASAYAGSYDPSNQSANFLGDVGSSITDFFQFPVTGGSSFQVVVTNTASQATCGYTFTIEQATCN